MFSAIISIVTGILPKGKIVWIIVAVASIASFAAGCKITTMFWKSEEVSAYEKVISDMKDKLEQRDNQIALLQNLSNDYEDRKEARVKEKVVYVQTDADVACEPDLDWVSKIDERILRGNRSATSHKPD